ncbi:hypothetical protein GCM10022631_22700 [Deinococcus rubellus]|uniref:Nucleotidyltransferase domain-containing protein n=1 Tax=Deinococcus rubellus TaxID=1889240 RepID=A0ABY5YIR3_9DEIO|nr:nucleotidyltransferase domain-containing protein [Deinococcus rubellus]UWX64237.1 nucleotidyltransferase domain-containing protein [Deinococcus rubellus]
MPKSTIRTYFPSDLHEAAAQAVTGFFSAQPYVQSVLLVNSCARGTATPQSDLDFAILIEAELEASRFSALEQAWQAHYQQQPVFEAFRRSGRFTGIHLDLITGQYQPTDLDDAGGPDSFELEIGNQVAYSFPLWQAADAMAHLRAQWLPYYDEALRRKRLQMVRDACAYDLEHVAFYTHRGLHFQAFDRFYKAFQEFLQALCISRRTYPIAYTKWIRELVAERLGLPDLYIQLPPL